MAMPEWGIVNNYFSVYGRAEVTFNQRGGCRFVRRISLSSSHTLDHSQLGCGFLEIPPRHQNPRLVELLPLQTMVPLTCRHLSDDVRITSSCQVQVVQAGPLSVKLSGTPSHPATRNCVKCSTDDVHRAGLVGRNRKRKRNCIDIRSIN